MCTRGKFTVIVYVHQKVLQLYYPYNRDPIAKKCALIFSSLTIHGDVAKWGKFRLWKNSELFDCLSLSLSVCRVVLELTLNLVISIWTLKKGWAIFVTPVDNLSYISSGNEVMTHIYD